MKPTSHIFVVNGGEEDHHGLKSHPAFLEIQMSDQEALKFIQMIAYRMMHKYPIRWVFSGELKEELDRNP
jgi:hypothetical protein